MVRPISLVHFANGPMPYHTHVYRALAQDNRFRFTAVFASKASTVSGADGYHELVSQSVDSLAGFDARFLPSAHKTPLSGGFFAIRDPYVVRILHELKPEVLWLHGYNHLSHQLAALLQIARRKPILVRDDQTLLASRPIWKQLAKQIGLRLLLRWCRPLYVGTRNKDWFLRYGANPKRMFLCPYSVDSSRLSRQAELIRGSRLAYREHLGISLTSQLVILTVARLIPEKQHKVLIEAFSRLRSVVPCTLLIVGSGPLEQQLKDHVKANHISDVVFSGFLEPDHVYTAYACSDVFVLPSASETWGLAVNEAMVIGLPVVVSDKVGSALDLVVHGESGFVVPSGNSDELFNALHKLAKSPELRSCFSRCGQQHIRSWNLDATLYGICTAVADAVGPKRWAEAGG